MHRYDKKGNMTLGEILRKEKVPEQRLLTMNGVAKFNRIIKNYLKMKRIDKEGNTRR